MIETGSIPMSRIPPTRGRLIHRALVALLMAGATLLHAQNLVPNGGFESGLTGWSNNTSGGASASFSVETSEPYAAARAMKIAVTNPGPQLHNVQTLGPTFTLAVGTSTTITFRARATTAGTKVRFVMQNSTYNNKEFTLSTAWERFTWNHTTTEGSPRLRIQYRSAGTVWLDEISVVANPAPGTTTRISSDLTIRHQTMDGIGGSIAFNLPDYVALSTTKKDEIENLLYVDCGIDIVRIRTGNSDTLNNELAMRAQRNGAKTLLTCWSPPASLKSNNSIVSGTLRIVSGGYDYAGFADWWYTKLSASNWTHDFISIQNEPSYDPGDKETCRFVANETVPATANGSASYRLALEAVYNRIKNEPKKPQFIAVDAETHSAFNSIAPTVSGLSYVNHLGFHNYGANDFAGVEARYNGKRGWMTEWGKDASATDPIGIKENWLLLATNIHETLVGADASAYLAWRMVHGNNTGQVWAMIGVENGQYQVQNSFYAVKHYAKHISSGHQRFEVTNSGSNANLRASGYINPAGNQLTLVVLNTGGTDDTISLRFPGLPVASATAFQTRQFDISGFPYRSLGAVNVANDQAISKNSITTYVIDLAETLNPYDPALLRVDGMEHRGDRVTLSIPAQPGHNFVLWKSTILADGSWQKVTNAVFTESNGRLFLTDPAPDANRAFYRVQRDTGL
jgi:glucuronoarabinoxylan endo-1,4-beta-xylanase